MRPPVTLESPSDYFAMLNTAAENHWWARCVEYLERRWVKSMMPSNVREGRERWNWLDIGCGTGHRLRLWGNWKCWDVCIGIEPEKEAARQASCAGMEVHCGSLPGLPDPGRKFRFVSALDVIQHVSPGERRDALAEIAECLEPGGYLLLRCNAPGLFSDPQIDRSLVHPADLRDWLAELGFSIRRESRFNALGGTWEDLRDAVRRRLYAERETAALKAGLPKAWGTRPKGHPAAALAGVLESRISATGLVKIPVGHSYCVMACKEGTHDRSPQE